jgi:hypothetical protein
VNGDNMDNVRLVELSRPKKWNILKTKLMSLKQTARVLEICTEV